MIQESKYKIELVTKTPMRIGGKEDPTSGLHNPVAMVGKKPVVPGSTLKGALRVEIENFLIEQYYDKVSNRWKEGKETMRPCIPATKLSKDEEDVLNKGYYKHYNLSKKDAGDSLKGKGCHYPSDRDCKENHTICPACYLLGAMGTIGFVRVPFLFADISSGELYSTRLDRVHGTVVVGTNREYQLIPQGTTFTGNLNVIKKNDILKWELGKPRPLKERTGGDAWLPSSEWTTENIIQKLIIERLQNIKLIGGYKSKGFGNVEIKVSLL